MLPSKGFGEFCYYLVGLFIGQNRIVYYPIIINQFLNKKYGFILFIYLTDV